MSTALTWEAAAEAAAQDICDRYQRLGGPSEANILLALRSTIDDMVDDTVTYADREFALVGAWALVGVVRHHPGEWGASSLDRIVKLVAAKQHDYGHGNITKFGVFGIIVRLSDKVERLSNLLKREAGPVDPGPAVSESIADTWDDLVGYAVLALMLIAGTFGLDLASDLLAQAKAMEADQPKFDSNFFADGSEVKILSYGNLSWGAPRQAVLNDVGNLAEEASFDGFASTPGFGEPVQEDPFAGVKWAATPTPLAEENYTTIEVEAEVRLFDDGTWKAYV